MQLDAIDKSCTTPYNKAGDMWLAWRYVGETAMVSTKKNTSNGATSTIPRGPSNPELVNAQALTVLFSVDKPQINRVYRLARDRIELGRRPSPPSVAIDDPMTSRVHASIIWDASRERYLLQDEESTNGTALNGKTCDRELLFIGDIIRIGDTILQFGRFEIETVGWKPMTHCLLRGRSGALRRVIEQIRQVADSELSVLIEGETGTGKDLVAREIHRLSGRPGPLQAVNCAAIPAELMESELFGHRRGAFSGAVRDQTGLLRAAQLGTLFLDEIGELAQPLQAKLLRVLDERKVRPVGASRSEGIDVRVVSATNRHLDNMVKAGTFRSDLLARLNQWPIVVPPLRERLDDLLPIFEHVVDQFGDGKRYEISADYFEALVHHDWSCNVRDLISLVRRAMIVLREGGRFELAHIPQELRPGHFSSVGLIDDGGPVLLPPPNKQPTAKELVALLDHFCGNVARVAEHVGCDRTQVYRWLRKHGLKPDAFRTGRGE